MASQHSQSSVAPKTVFTVSELNRRIKQLLEKELPFVWITGEISNLRTPSSGHLYFTLKDNQAQLNAVMFRGQARRLAATPQDGLAVLGMGRVSVYEPRGTYQVIIEYLEPQGLGDLQLAFEQLKRKMAAEGLFDADHKKPLPFLPRKVHVITSPTGAVIFDTISIIQRRFANLSIVLIPTHVQGANAATEIVQAIDLLNRQPDAEVAILARGGGSLEDLQAFNDEMVARAIHRSRVPIIAAIGHETDYTIADFVADYRAPTPSGAAEIVVPERRLLLESVRVLERQLNVAVRTQLTAKRKALDDYRQRLVDPRRRIYDGRLHLDELSNRMAISFRRTLRNDRRALATLLIRLMQNPLRARFKILKQKLKQSINNNIVSMNNHMINIRWKHQVAASRLTALDPMAVLERGYSITRKMPQRTIIKKARQVRIDDQVEITLASGSLRGRIEGKMDDGPQKL